MDPRGPARAAGGASRGARARGCALDSAAHHDDACRASDGRLRLHQMDGAGPRPRGLLTHPGGPTEGTRGVDEGDRDPRAEGARVVRVREQSFRGAQSGDGADAAGDDGDAGGGSVEAWSTAHAVLSGCWRTAHAAPLV